MVFLRNGHTPCYFYSLFFNSDRTTSHFLEQVRLGYFPLRIRSPWGDCNIDQCWYFSSLISMDSIWQQCGGASPSSEKKTTGCFFFWSEIPPTDLRTNHADLPKRSFCDTRHIQCRKKSLQSPQGEWGLTVFCSQFTLWLHCILSFIY